MSHPYLPAGLPEPAPAPDGVDAGFWDAARRHELAVQLCRDCGTFQVPPEWVCHRCHSRDLEWRTVPGRGRIHSWTRVHHAAHPALCRALPYLVVLVDLAEAPDVRLIGNLLGPADQEVAIDGEVEAVFEDHEGGFTLVQWQSA